MPDTNSLTPREREVPTALLSGASEKEVAACLGISVHTVHTYVKQIHRKLGVTSRAELLAVFLNPTAEVTSE